MCRHFFIRINQVFVFIFFRIAIVFKFFRHQTITINFRFLRVAFFKFLQLFAIFIHKACHNHFIRMTRMTIVIDRCAKETITLDIFLRRTPWFKMCNFSTCNTVYKTCHYTIIEMTHIPFPVNLRRMIGKTCNIFLRLISCFRFCKDVTCQFIDKMRHHGVINMNDIPIISRCLTNISIIWNVFLSCNAFNCATNFFTSFIHKMC